MKDDAQAQERRLRERIEILKQEVEHGRVHFAPHLFEEMKKSLLTVRYGPDGEVDLSTVDARVRSMALAVASIRYRDDTKRQVSLREIQDAYFGWLGSQFGHLRKFAADAKQNPHQAGRAAASDPDFVKRIAPAIPEFMGVLTEFWSEAGEAAHIHLEDARYLKAVFGGDLFPSAFTNIASTCGIYVDTIVLPDPFLRSAKMFELWSPERRTYYFVKHALNVLSYESLARADVDPPIVAVVPDRTALEESSQDLISRIARADAVVHASRVFNVKLSSFEEALEFVDKFDDLDSVAAAVARPDRVLFDLEWQGSLVEQVQRALKEQPEMAAYITKPGRIVLFQAVGRMGQASDMLLRTQRLGGVPLVDAPTSWRYLQWKLEYDAARVSDSPVNELHVVRALQAAAGSGRVPWLGRVPPEALIALRTQGAMQELRSTVSDGVDRLAKADPSDFWRTADLVVSNLDLMLAEHQEQTRKISERLLRFGFKDVGSWLAIGGIEVASAATGMPLYGLAAIAGNQLFDVPRLRDFPEKIRQLIEDASKVRRSPVGMLFRHVAE